MEIKKILNEKYSLLTSFDINNEHFNGIYQTDLLSAAIKSSKPDNALITLINSLNTIACAVMCDIKVVILSECEVVVPEIIKKADENDIVLIITKLKSYEVVLDLYNRGLYE
ncbi:hypothetical protein LJC17_01760 [Acholeplasma sp. OttesenSCG-928-E16]|nr:hypothetical protein [Acholeplasma sp. OttesenSCG-928-E16]